MRADGSRATSNRMSRESSRVLTRSSQKVRTTSRHGLLVRGLLLALACLALAESGCVRRRLTVRTWPPGAQVFIDDQEIGTTPCSTSFVYYGTRKVTVIKGGYRTETLYHKISPPWYQYPPLDFISENLIISDIRDERVIDIQMIPEEAIQPNELLDRAQGLRDGARTGTITPLPGAAPNTAQQPLGLPGQGLPGGEPILYEPLPAAGATPSGTTLLPLPPLPSVGQ